MIKFVLGFIALVFIGLALYIYTDKETVTPTKNAIKTTHKAEVVSIEKDTSSIQSKIAVQTKPISKKVVKDMQVSTEELRDDGPLDDGEVVDIAEESPEKILQMEIESGLTEWEGVDNTPLDSGI